MDEKVLRLRGRSRIRKRNVAESRLVAMHEIKRIILLGGSFTSRDKAGHKSVCKNSQCGLDLKIKILINYGKNTDIQRQLCI